MKKFLLLQLLFFANNSTFGQINLVQNPSFEIYSHCPNALEQIKYATYWNAIDTLWSPGDSVIYEPYCTPAYCNTCATCATCYDVSVPVNARFTHLPRTGNGMVEAQMYYNESAFNPSDRTYIQSKLKNTLTSGAVYCVTFYVTLEQQSAYAVDKIGAYFDDGTIDTTQNCGLPQITHIPQVYSTTIINDTLNWVKIQGSFTATGNEKYITIGNFFDAAHTDTIRVYFPIAVSSGNTFVTNYLVDDVSVIPLDVTANAGPDGITSSTGDSVFIGTTDGYLPCKWYTATGTLIDSNIAGFKVKPSVTTKYVMELDVCGTLSWDTVTVFVAPLSTSGPFSKVEGVTCYPNPAASLLTVEGAKGCSVSFFDIVGREVFNTAISSDKEGVDISGLESGVYFVHVVDGVSGYSVVRKVVKE